MCTKPPCRGWGYRVTILRASYINDAGEKKTFTLDVPGVRIKLGMTETLVEQVLYFLIDRNQSLSDTVQSRRDIYGVKTSVSVLHRLRMAEADKPPSQGEIIRALGAKKITTVHIDEYKAKGTKRWELIMRDEHGRLLVSLFLRRRSEKKLKVILPQKAQRALQKERHKRLWSNRYLFFTHEANLSAEDKALLEELPAEHQGSILEHIVAFTRHIWDLFNSSSTKLAAHLNRLDLIAEGCGSLSKHFAKVMSLPNIFFRSMITYIDDPKVQRHSLAETTVRTVRRVDHVRQGFKSAKGRAAHFKLWQYRRYLP